MAYVAAVLGGLLGLGLFLAARQGGRKLYGAPVRGRGRPTQPHQQSRLAPTSTVVVTTLVLCVLGAIVGATVGAYWIVLGILLGAFLGRLLPDVVFALRHRT